MNRLIDGAAFLEALDATPPSLWGDGDQIAWAAGEPTLIVGTQGVGKTTLAQQLLLARIGIGEPRLLGLDVTRCERALYIAADRPLQAARSMRRMVPADHVDRLRDRLSVWRGPLDFDIGRHPARLYEFAAEQGAQVVVLDSLKDLASKLTDDEVGANVNAAMQRCVAADIDVLGLHHQRKGQQGAKPRTLEDVYGSTWLTAGCGSVLLLWGKPGDPIVELEHLKQPAEPVGPMRVMHDHETGRSRIFRQADLADLARDNGGLTVRHAAELLYDSTDPADNELEKARRRLKGLVTRGVLVEDSSGAPNPTRYRPAPRTHGVPTLTHAGGQPTRPPLRGGARVGTHAPESLPTLPETLDPDEHARAVQDGGW